MQSNGEYPRLLRPSLIEDLNLHPVVVVVGARQVGKSTLCQEIAQSKGFTGFTLDDWNLLNHARRDPAGFLASLGVGPIFIDEAQRAPEIFLAIKAAVDRSQTAGHFLLCGSNQPGVRRAVGDSLVGRAVYRTLYPLTLSELRLEQVGSSWTFLFGASDLEVLNELERRGESHGALDWQEVVSTGGFPRALSAPKDRRLKMLDEYIAVFTSRDIREVLSVDAADRFEMFVRLLATRVAQPLNYSSLATDLGVSVNTVRRWTDALRRSYLIDLIPSYSRNAGHRVIKSPKLVFVDSALAQAAAREVAPTGFHLENFIATDIGVWAGAAADRAVYHWRLSSGQEVDFVLECRGELLPVEVKASSSVSFSDGRHLRTFLDRHDRATRGLLLSADPIIRGLGQGVIAAPWWAAI